MSEPGKSERRQPALTDAAHWAGFLVSGGLAFLTDAVALWLLTRLGIGPLVARLGAIMLAMLVAWMAHRTWTFRVAAPPSLHEFLRYAAVGWTTAALNYGVFALILLALPGTSPFLALFVSSVVATAFSYAGMRLAAFRR